MKSFSDEIFRGKVRHSQIRNFKAVKAVQHIIRIRLKTAKIYVSIL
jgi:hypothetical protein